MARNKAIWSEALAGDDYEIKIRKAWFGWVADLWKVRGIFGGPITPDHICWRWGWTRKHAEFRLRKHILRANETTEYNKRYYLKKYARGTKGVV